jgi:hypothetical protein
MNPNLSTTYVAIQTERGRLASRAERGWWTEQAVTGQRRPSVAAQARRSLGTLLVRTGNRLQGTPRQVRQAPAS